MAILKIAKLGHPVLIKKTNEINDLNKIDKYESVDYFLFDYKPLKDELPGGNSKRFDWNIIKNLKTKK